MVLFDVVFLAELVELFLAVAYTVGCCLDDNGREHVGVCFDIDSRLRFVETFGLVQHLCSRLNSFPITCCLTHADNLLRIPDYTVTGEFLGVAMKFGDEPVDHLGILPDFGVGAPPSTTEVCLDIHHIVIFELVDYIEAYGSTLTL